MGAGQEYLSQYIFHFWVGGRDGGLDARKCRDAIVLRYDKLSWPHAMQGNGCIRKCLHVCVLGSRGVSS